MDKQKQHYKVKVVPLFLAIIFGIGYGIIILLQNDPRNMLESRYTSSVDGLFKPYCEGEKENTKCGTGVEYEVDGKIYVLELSDDAIATRDNLRTVLYDPNNPADAISGSSERAAAFDPQKEIMKKYQKAFPRIVLILAILCLVDAFLGYFFDKLAKASRDARQEIANTEADLADQQKESSQKH